eukprot:scaffold1314_cov386-Pavlova_lutheri.AAC.31
MPPPPYLCECGLNFAGSSAKKRFRFSLTGVRCNDSTLGQVYVVSFSHSRPVPFPRLRVPLSSFENSAAPVAPRSASPVERCADDVGQTCQGGCLLSIAKRGFDVNIGCIRQSYTQGDEQRFVSSSQQHDPYPCKREQRNVPQVQRIGDLTDADHERTAKDLAWNAAIIAERDE